MAGYVLILILVGKIMAKNIKQMAEEYAYTNWQSDDYHDGAAEGLPFDAIGHTERTYMAGANYVLEQIEQFIYEKHVKGNLPLFDLTYLIDKLKEK